MFKILAISGSQRGASSNTALLRGIRQLIGDTSEVDIYTGIGGLPHFSPDLDNDEPDPAVADLRQRIATADAVIICTPEYAHGVPGSLKNALDWVVGSGEFSHKATAVISASPSESGASYAFASLMETIKTMDASVVESSLSVPFVRSKMGADDRNIDADLTAKLLALIDDLRKTAAAEAAS